VATAAALMCVRLCGYDHVVSHSADGVRVQPEDLAPSSALLLLTPPGYVYLEITCMYVCVDYVYIYTCVCVREK